jgi:uncharacterized protein (TIGR03435 family)
MKPIFAGLLFLASAFAQQPGFDVVSIKPSDPLSNGMRVGISPSGTFEAKGVTLLDLISQAYDVRIFQIVGASGWMGTDKYEIITKDEAKGPSESDLKGMNDNQREQVRDRLLGKLRVMLSDRYQLKFHRETKEMPVYGLTIAKGGVKLEAAAEGDNSESRMNGSRTEDGKSSLTGKNLPLENLARFLSNQTARPVIDQTGLAGKYNFKLIYAPDMNDLTGPSIFTALQEQLGLKLESQKGPADVLVIDSVQKPSEN